MYCIVFVLFSQTINLIDSKSTSRKRGQEIIQQGTQHSIFNSALHCG